MTLVDQPEKVWLFLDDTISGKDKYWFYEGFIKDIVTVLEVKPRHTDEVYIVSKKYEWLLCVNHHDHIIASENEMTIN